MRIIGTLILALLLGATAGASSFPIEVTADFGELQMEYTTHATGQTAIVTLVNKTGQTVACSATFKNGPETVRSKKSTIDPKSDGKIFHTAKRNIIKMRVELSCAPAPVK